MFDRSEKPHVIGIPPGADFPDVLVRRVLDHYATRPPEELARVRILVNTRRMQRRLSNLFGKGPARLLPKIGLVTDVDALLPGAALPVPVTRLRRRLELAQLTARLIEKEPGLASRAAAVDLADSLALLLDEMQGEGIAPERLDDIRIGDDSLHWERSLKFLRVAADYVQRIAPLGIDEEARRRGIIELIVDRWKASPPQFPVIVAGSTGSRAATLLLMCAAARLPRGGLVLPGFDFDLPGAIWDTLAASRELEDHPQYRFAALLKKLGVPRGDVRQWGQAPDLNRNTLISLSLRPAYVTDQWLSEGPDLGDLQITTGRLSLIEAPQPKEEALAIACALREAVEDGKKVALITTDRTLSRQVTAALSRWSILPDDSAGIPLSLTAPGRFLRHVALLIGTPPATDQLIGLLKHPLTRTGRDDRVRHLDHTRALELFIRQQAVASLTPGLLDRFASGKDEDLTAWAAWLSKMLRRLLNTPDATLAATASIHLELAEAFANGPGDGTGALWETPMGVKVRAEIDRFRDEADFEGVVTFEDYRRLLEKALAAESHRDPDRVRPDVMIWGTLEARVQGAGLVILGGLNEGAWPEQSEADPWLNRRLRRELGLLLPEREIGLAAHDYQQAVAAEEVVLSRAKRTDDSQAVPSRWLNRLTNLLRGLPRQNGPAALSDMISRGNRFLSMAAGLDIPDSGSEAAERPAPAPPSVIRPKKLSVTEIRTLIRDPYAIYAKHILNLRPLKPLVPKPDARLKGEVFHRILERFFGLDADFSDPVAARHRLFRIAQVEFDQGVPWLATRAQWHGHLEDIANWLIETEQLRRLTATPVAREVYGLFEVPGTRNSISGKADRIDRLKPGGLAIFDYKTGTPPSPDQIRRFDRQLLIEAVMAEAGAFEDVPAETVRTVEYISVGRSRKITPIELKGSYRTVTIQSELAQLLNQFASESVGYISRRAMEKERYEGDFDHLARFGEWDASQTTTPKPVR